MLVPLREVLRPLRYGTPIVVLCNGLEVPLSFNFYDTEANRYSVIEAYVADNKLYIIVQDGGSMY